ELLRHRIWLLSGEKNGGQAGAGSSPEYKYYFFLHSSAMLSGQTLGTGPVKICIMAVNNPIKMFSGNSVNMINRQHGQILDTSALFTNKMIMSGCISIEPVTAFSTA